MNETRTIYEATPNQSPYITRYQRCHPKDIESTSKRKQTLSLKPNIWKRNHYVGTPTEVCQPLKPFHSMKTLYWDTCKYSSHLSDSNIVITLFCWFFPQSFRPTFKSGISKNCKAILYSAQQQQLNNLDFIKNFSAVRYLKKLPFIEQQNLPLGSNMHDIQRSGFQSKMHSLLTVSST